MLEKPSSVVHVEPSKVSNRISLIFVFYLIAKTDITLFRNNDNLDLVIFGLTSVIFFFVLKLKLNKSFFILLSFILLLLSIQVHLYGGALFSILRKISTSFLTPYFIFRIIGIRRLVDGIIKLTVLFTAISIIFWIFENISPQFRDLLKVFVVKFQLDPAFNNSLIIYNSTLSNQSYFGLLRNSGIWHEPGAFAVLIITAFILNHHSSSTAQTKNGIILFIGLLSTFSTAGYLVLFFYISMFYLSNRKMNSILRIITFSFIISIFAFLYTTFDFMGEKIENQFEIEMERDITDTGRGRFFGIRREINTMLNYPFHGRGLLVSTLPEQNSGEAVAYGTFAIGATIGLFPFLIFLYIFFRSCTYLLKIYNRERYAPLVFLTFFLNNLAQSVIFGPLLTILILLSTMKTDYKVKHLIKRPQIIPLQ